MLRKNERILFQLLKTLAIHINIECLLVRENLFTHLYQIFLSYLIGMVDTIFADVAQPDQARILALNAHNFLKNGGHFVISIKVNEKNSERLFNHEYGFI